MFSSGQSVMPKGESIKKHKFLKEQVKNKLLISDSIKEAYFFRIDWSKQTVYRWTS
jgi:hypothetical protein